MGVPLDERQITEYIRNSLEGVDVVVASQDNGAPEVAWGDSFFIYDPNRDLDEPHRFPFATIVTQDYGGFDELSDLDRPGVFRLNIGVSKETYARLFPGDREHDFAALDRLMPHPVYGRNHFVCVLNPSQATFESVKPLLAEAHQIAVRRAQGGGAIAHSKGSTQKEVPEVLFVCVHNAGRSQMAAGLLNKRGGGRVHVRSAGSSPASELNPRVVEAMQEIGIDISQEFPKPLNDEFVKAADVVITMGCGDACPIYPGKRYEDWELDDPAEQDLETVRRIRDEIDARVQALVNDLITRRN